MTNKLSQEGRGITIGERIKPFFRNARRSSTINSAGRKAAVTSPGFSLSLPKSPPYRRVHAEPIRRLIKFDINDRVNYAHGMERIDSVINMPTSSNVLIESFRLYYYGTPRPFVPTISPANYLFPFLFLSLFLSAPRVATPLPLSRRVFLSFKLDDSNRP